MVSNSIQIICNAKLECFEIPIFCINYPKEYLKEVNEVDELEETIDPSLPKNKFIARSTDYPDQEIELNMTDDIKVLKQEIGRNLQKQASEIRVFYQGKELQEGKNLSDYNLSHDIILIFSIRI